MLEVKCIECSAFGKFILPAGAIVSGLGHSPQLEFVQPVSHEQSCQPSFIKIVNEKAKEQIMLRYLKGLSKATSAATFEQCYKACKAKVWLLFQTFRLL